MVRSGFRPKFSSVSIAALVVLFQVTGCAARQRIVGELPSAHLEDRDLSERIVRLPFDHAWSNPTTDWSTYKGVYVRPIRTDLLPKDAWESSVSLYIDSEKTYLKEADTIAEYCHGQILAALKARGGVRLSTVFTEPQSGVLVIDMALTELEFSHPISRAGALAVPVPGAGSVVSAISDPHATFAMRLTDGKSGELVATAADRKFSPTRIVDLNKFTVTSSIREICTLWADEIADTFTTDALTEVKEKKWDWSPW